MKPSRADVIAEKVLIVYFFLLLGWANEGGVYSELKSLDWDANMWIRDHICGRLCGWLFPATFLLCYPWPKSLGRFSLLAWFIRIPYWGRCAILVVIDFLVIGAGHLACRWRN